MTGLPAGAIRARGIAKQYRTGRRGEALPNLRETLMAPFTARARPIDEASRRWALRDISFDVNPGEVLGILGGNGAGKSTLLKILSRIVEPTAGRIEMAGRLGCLLEVGTGFHRELTGRENVYLNGAILGMSRREISAKLDAIVDFSGIAQFIDTPVKHYSSGMYLRLGFAVAAHVDPEVLIIDEVLAVGDAAFQAKCIRKVGQLVGEGRTVLIVSHQLTIIQKLCSRALMIREGVVAADGAPAAVVADYLETLEQGAGMAIGDRTDRRGRGQARVMHLYLGSEHTTSLVSGAPARFEMDVETQMESLDCSFTIYDALGDAVVSFNTANPSIVDVLPRGRRQRFQCDIPALLLRPGRYRINVGVSSPVGEMEDHIEGALIFDVLPGLVDGREAVTATGYGRVELPHKWIAS
jgi:lipopolysaccharide transport system ATP-binding protein